MQELHPSNWRSRPLLAQLSVHPRQIVFLCFSVVFVVTFILAARQYQLGFERQVDQREHSLQQQASTIDAVIDNGMSQLRLLRNVVERLLLNVQMEDGETSIDAVLQQALRDRNNPFWGLPVPAFDASVRTVGDQQLSAIPGFSRDDGALLQDLRMSRVISQVLPAQFLAKRYLEHVLFVSTAGLVVSYPSIPDDKLSPFLRDVAASRLMHSYTDMAKEQDVNLTTVQAKPAISGARFLFSTQVLFNGMTRGSLVFDVPQQRLQTYMYAATPPEEFHVLLDPHGLLIASNQEIFNGLQGNWFKTLPETIPGMSIPAILQTGHGVLHISDRYFFYRVLQDSGLLLVNEVPINALRWSVIEQFSTVFLLIWLSLGVLLVVTLFVVDRLLLNQMLLNTQLTELGLVDTLTQLANRRRLQIDFKGLIRRFKGEKPIALLMIDIDRFKAINDNWGHSTGDEVLKHLATLCRALVRPQDLVARYGGEEFCVVLPATVLTQAHEIAEKLRVAIEQSVCLPDPVMMLASAPSKEVRLTVSIGVAELCADQVNELDALIAKADRRLYAAKQSGRNRVVSDDSLSSD